MNLSFKWQNNFLPICLRLVIRFQTGKTLFFSEILTHTAVYFMEKGLLFPGEMWVCGWNMRLPHFVTQYIDRYDWADRICFSLLGLQIILKWKLKGK